MARPRAERRACQSRNGCCWAGRARLPVPAGVVGIRVRRRGVRSGARLVCRRASRRAGGALYPDCQRPLDAPGGEAGIHRGRAVRSLRGRAVVRHVVPGHVRLSRCWLVTAEHPERAGLSKNAATGDKTPVEGSEYALGHDLSYERLTMVGEREPRGFGSPAECDTTGTGSIERRKIAYDRTKAAEREEEFPEPDPMD